MSFESYIQQIKDIGKKARERDVLSPFRAASNQMALGRTSELEALNRQQIEAEQQAMAQQQDRGFETLGGSPAAERRFNEAVAAGGQRYNQAASQLGIQQGQAEQARDARADAFGLQAAQAGIQYEALQRKEQMQMQLYQLQSAQNALNRASAEKMAAARDATQRASIAAQTANAQRQMDIAMKRIGAEMKMNQLRYGGGGGTMTASYSTGASTLEGHLKSMGVMR